MLKAVFFDIDDTILDYDQCAVITLRDACARLGVAYSEEVQREYREVDDRLWALQKQSVLTIAQVLEQRNEHMMAYFGLTDGISFQEAFIDAFAESHALVEGAAEVLRAVGKKLPVYSASNGFFDVQVNRLGKAGVLQDFNRLFVSDRVGYEKPDPRFFAHCLAETGLAAHEVLMVGDSVAADVKGALQAGWNVCYLNRRGKPGGVECHEITGIAQLLPLLEKEYGV